MNELEKEIELYLDGEMSPEQKVAFEEKIKANPHLQNDVIIYQEMHTMYNDDDWAITESTTKNQRITAYQTFLKSEKGKTIANSIQNAESTYFKEKAQSGVRKWMLYVASIAAIFIIVFFALYLSNGTIDNESLYAEYKNWDDLPSLTLRNKSTELATAEKLFKQQNYQEALVIFLKHQAVEPKDLNPQILLYTGIVQLELNQNREAIKTFEQLLHSNTLDASKANWYLALTYLKMDNIDKTKEVLQIVIRDPKNDQYQKAKDLLNSL